MKSGLEGRNKTGGGVVGGVVNIVSMKSGLEGRNKRRFPPRGQHQDRLNEVRPRRPEQTARRLLGRSRTRRVSMKSGLEGRNKPRLARISSRRWSLNEVRPRRPEQTLACCRSSPWVIRLNEVRPRRPEQAATTAPPGEHETVSMKSGLEGRNKFWYPVIHSFSHVSQ